MRERARAREWRFFSAGDDPSSPWALRCSVLRVHIYTPLTHIHTYALTHTHRAHTHTLTNTHLVTR